MLDAFKLVPSFNDAVGGSVKKRNKLVFNCDHDSIKGHKIKK